jgi:hypothetical protein
MWRLLCRPNVWSLVSFNESFLIIRCSDTITIGGFICQKCYRRRKRILSTSGATVYVAKDRSCHNCHSKDTSVWYKHESLAAAYVCHSCHSSGKAIGTQKSCCSACGSLKSTKWSAIADGSIVCRKCTRQLVKANKMDSSYLDLHQSIPPVAEGISQLAVVTSAVSKATINNAPRSIYDLIHSE